MAHSHSFTTQDLESFLNTISASPPAIRICPDCGSVMMQVEATLFLWPTNRSWNILLPLCPKCDHDRAESHAVPSYAAS
jgi:hypothetical protein